ncbi:MAG: hypothetical protein U0790_09965 [Isosphaeraceae bacterium]
MVHLVDRPPLRFGPTSSASRWLAIVPPAETTFFVRFDALEWCPPDPGRAAPAEVLASYEEPAADGKGREQRAAASRAWPPEVSAEIERLDGVYRVIVSSQPIEQWRFETLRAGYQGLLKRAGDRSDLEDALRSRLARLTQSEQASRSARTIETILAKSRRRDQQISGLKRDLARLDQSRDRGFDVVGYIQPSARKADGNKLFALIGSEGTRIAYLEIPPGLDPEPYLAHRVGVRGRARFSEDLGSRLISVRDMERVAER